MKANDMQEDEIQLTAAKGEYIALLGFCLVSMVVVAALLWTQLVTPWAALTFPLLFGGLLFAIKKLMQTQPEYWLDQQGIRFGPHLGRVWIPWVAVTAIEVKADPGHPPYVALQLRPDAGDWPTPATWRQRLFRIIRARREQPPTVYLYTAGLTVSHDQVLTLLHRFWRQQKAFVNAGKRLHETAIAHN